MKISNLTKDIIEKYVKKYPHLKPLAKNAMRPNPYQAKAFDSLIEQISLFPALSDVTIREYHLFFKETYIPEGERCGKL